MRIFPKRITYTKKFESYDTKVLVPFSENFSEEVRK